MIRACNLKLPIDRRKGRQVKKSPSSLMRLDKRAGRVSRRASIEKDNQRSRVPEQTPDGRRHRQLFAAWVADPNRDTFAAFILSAYC